MERLLPGRWATVRPGLLLATVTATALICVPVVLQLFGLANLGPARLYPVAPVVAFLIGLALDGDARRVMLTAAGWGLLVITALFAVSALQTNALIGLVPAAILVGTLAVGRFPVAGALTIAVITAFVGTIEVYTPFKHGVVVDLLLVSLWLAAIWSLARHGGPSRAWIWPGVAVVAAYLLLTLFSVGLAEDSSAAMRSFRTSSWYALAFVLVAYAPWPPGAMLRLSRGLLVVAFCAGAYAAYRWQVGPTAKETAFASATSYTNFIDGELGVVGSFASRKTLAAWSSLMLPLCVAYALVMRDGWRFVGAAAGALCALAIVISEVRIGIVAGLAGLAVVFVLTQLAPGLPGARLGVGMVAAIAAAAVGIGAFGLATGGDDASKQRFENILQPENDLSVQGRLFKWRTAIREIDERPFGYGLGTAGFAQRRQGRFLNTASLDLDNGYLKVAYEQGVFVAVLYVLAIVALLIGIVLRVLSATEDTAVAFGAAAAGALTGLLALMTAGAYQEGVHALAAWMVVGLGVSQFSRLPAPQRESSPASAPA
jgi:hypothetical protein